MSIYVGQDKLILTVNTGVDLSSVDTALLKYKKPDNSEGSFVLTISDAVGGVCTYDVQPGEIDQYREWVFWAHMTYSDGQIAIGDPFAIDVKAEGYIP